MTKPVYEIPVGDGDSYPSAGAGRRAQASTDTQGGFPLAPPAAAPSYQAPAQQAPIFQAPTYQAPTYQAPSYASPAPPSAPPTAVPQAIAPPAALHEAPPPSPSQYNAPSAPAQYVLPAATPAPTYQAPPTHEPAIAPVQALPQETMRRRTLEQLPAAGTAPTTGAGQAGTDPDLLAALNAVVSAGASDLHVGVNAAPMMRIDGALKPIPGFPVWNSEKVNAALRSIMSPAHESTFAETLELDFAYTLSDTSRFRVNVYQQRNVLGSAFRLIPTEIKQLPALGVPDKVAKFAQLPRGLVLVTGPTGSGKSTTLAALIDLVNSTRTDHIVTVEDPIEFIHSNKKSLVNQREVGHDTHSFNNALKHVLRQDPDVILIGELRDLETISVALTAAETGHLVFATLHTQDAAQTIDRVIDVFPPHQQGQVRAQLAATLQGVICQTLVKKIGGGGRAVATEVLVTTPAVANLIREGKTYQIHSVMQAGREQGMHTMDQHLADLVNAGVISHQAAYDRAHDLEDLKQLIQRAGSAESGASIDGTRQSAGIDFGDSFSSRGN
jgi:twitching motility protein PilT